MRTPSRTTCTLESGSWRHAIGISRTSMLSAAGHRDHLDVPREAVLPALRRTIRCQISVRGELGAALGVDDARRDGRLHDPVVRPAEQLRAPWPLGRSQVGPGQVARADREHRVASPRCRRTRFELRERASRGRGRRIRRPGRAASSGRPHGRALPAVRPPEQPDRRAGVFGEQAFLRYGIIVGAAPQASAVFSEDVLERRVIQHRLGQQLLEPAVLIFQGLQPPRLRDLQPAILGFPLIEGRVRDPVPPA